MICLFVNIITYFDYYQIIDNNSTHYNNIRISDQCQASPTY